MTLTDTITRTNYFRVTDKEAFRDLVSTLRTDKHPAVFMEREGCVGFYADSAVRGIEYEEAIPESDYWDLIKENMVARIQELLYPGEACIITDISHDKFMSINATSLIITERDSKHINLLAHAVDTAAEMIGIPYYDTLVVG